jgi:hypothetical protein
MANIRNERGSTPEQMLRDQNQNSTNLKSYIDGLKKVTNQKQKSRVPQKNNTFLKSQQSAANAYG